MDVPNVDHPCQPSLPAEETTNQQTSESAGVSLQQAHDSSASGLVGFGSPWPTEAQQPVSSVSGNQSSNLRRQSRLAKDPTVTWMNFWDANLIMAFSSSVLAKIVSQINTLALFPPELLEVVGQIRLEDQGSESFNLNNYAFWVQTLYQRINDVCVVYENMSLGSPYPIFAETNPEAFYKAMTGSYWIVNNLRFCFVGVDKVPPQLNFQRFRMNLLTKTHNQGFKFVDLITSNLALRDQLQSLCDFIQKCYAAFNIQSDYSGIPTLPTSLLGENNGHNRGDRAASDQLPSNVKLYSPTDPVVDFEPLSPFQPLKSSEVNQDNNTLSQSGSASNSAQVLNPETNDCSNVPCVDMDTQPTSSVQNESAPGAHQKSQNHSSHDDALEADVPNLLENQENGADLTNARDPTDIEYISLEVMKLLASLKISVPHAHLIAARAARENEVVSCGDKRATGCATLNNDTEDATSSKTANQIDGSSPPQSTITESRSNDVERDTTKRRYVANSNLASTQQYVTETQRHESDEHCNMHFINEYQSTTPPSQYADQGPVVKKNPTPEHHHAGGYGTSYPAPLVDPKLTDLSIHNHIYEESQDFHNPILDSEGENSYQSPDIEATEVEDLETVYPLNSNNAELQQSPEANISSACNAEQQNSMTTQPVNFDFLDPFNNTPPELQLLREANQASAFSYNANQQNFMIDDDEFMSFNNSTCTRMDCDEDVEGENTFKKIWDFILETGETLSSRKKNRSEQNDVDMTAAVNKWVAERRRIDFGASTYYGQNIFSNGNEGLQVASDTTMPHIQNNGVSQNMSAPLPSFGGQQSDYLQQYNNQLPSDAGPFSQHHNLPVCGASCLPNAPNCEEFAPYQGIPYDVEVVAAKFAALYRVEQPQQSYFNQNQVDTTVSPTHVHRNYEHYPEGTCFDNWHSGDANMTPNVDMTKDTGMTPDEDMAGDVDMNLDEDKTAEKFEMTCVKENMIADELFTTPDNSNMTFGQNHMTSNQNHLSFYELCMAAGQSYITSGKKHRTYRKKRRTHGKKHRTFDESCTTSDASDITFGKKHRTSGKKHRSSGKKHRTSNKKDRASGKKYMSSDASSKASDEVDMAYTKEDITSDKTDMPSGPKDIFPDKTIRTCGNKDTSSNPKDMTCGREGTTSDPKDVTCGKEDITSDKKDVTCGEEEVVSGKKEMVFGKEEMVSGKEEMVFGKEEMVSGKEDTTCGKEEMVSDSKDITCGRKRKASDRQNMTGGEDDMTSDELNMTSGKKHKTSDKVDMTSDEEETICREHFSDRSYPGFKRKLINGKLPPRKRLCLAF